MPDIAAQPLAVAPTFTIETTHGPVSLADYRGKKRVVLYFMREFSCLFCQRHAASLGRLYPRLKAANVEVLVIGGGNVKAAQTLERRFQLPFPVAADPERSTYKLYSLDRSLGFWQWSRTFLIDEHGRLRYTRSSQRPNASLDEMELLREVSQLDA